MNGVEAAFLGKFGSDEVAQCLKDTLDQLGIDRSRCRSFEGENGFACVTLAGSDRVFIGSNKGGVAAVNPYGFTQEDGVVQPRRCWRRTDRTRLRKRRKSCFGQSWRRWRRPGRWWRWDSLPH